MGICFRPSSKAQAFLDPSNWNAVIDRSTATHGLQGKSQRILNEQPSTYFVFAIAIIDMLVNVAYGEIQQSELKSTFTADVVTSG
jgi:hypothetical protein